MAAPQSSKITTTVSIDAELLKKYQERCRHLNDALEAERAKTSKLRRYISRLNTKPATPLQAQQDLASLQTLIEDQNKLIEQLYGENQTLRQSAAVKTAQNQQLLTANDKLKARIIELRRQVREFVEQRTGATIKKSSKHESLQAVALESNAAASPRAPIKHMFNRVR